tara:strand:- start:131 stop:1288 length:1158 start_codon:yes stop_codon:yes gene_type:complete
MDFSTLDKDTLETFAADGIPGAAEELAKRQGSIGSGAEVTEAVDVDLTDPNIKRGIDTLKIFLEDIATPTEVLDPDLRPSQLKDLSQDQMKEILKSIGKPIGDQSSLRGLENLYASLPGRTMTDATLAAGAEAAKNLGLEGLLQGPNLSGVEFNQLGIPTTNNADLNQDGVVDEVDEQISISSLPAQPFVPGVSSKPMKRKGPAGLAGLGEAVRFALNPIGFLLSKLPGKQYDMTAPLTAGLTSDRILVGPGAAVSGGIYSARNIGGGQTNTPLSMAADFYDPETGKTRFDRAFDRFLKTGRRRDLIGASRSGAGARRLLRQARSGIIQDASGRNVIIPGRSTGVGGQSPGPRPGQRGRTPGDSRGGGFGGADFGNRSDDKFGAL